MANLTWWRRPSPLSLRRDVEEILDEFDMPRMFRRNMLDIFDEDLSPRAMSREMDRLFDEFASPPPLRRRLSRLFERPSGGSESYMPTLDMSEKDNTYVVRVDLPGVREQDIRVSLSDDNVLTISGERRKEETRRERGYEYTERGYGYFTRSIELPRGCETNKIDADFRNGVLEVHIPKSESAMRARQIPIHAGGSGAREEPRVLEGNGGGKQKQVNPG